MDADRSTSPRLEARDVRTAAGGPYGLTVRPGECLGLCGPSGAGKTLLLRALADLDPHPGRMWLDGVPCRDIPPWEWRRRVAYLPTDTHWWAPGVGEHFACHPGEQVLHALGFGPQVMDWQGERLSAGERQRLGLLRLLCNRPRVLLLDEPTANLDPDLAAAVEARLQALRHDHGVALVWVSHQRGQLGRVADRVLELTTRGLEPGPCA